MPKGAWSVDVNISGQLRKRMRKIPGALDQMKQNAVEAAADVFIMNTKEMVQREDHVDTALFINSIGKLSDYPGVYKTGRRGRAATAFDVVYNLNKEGGKVTLEVGTNVPYAGILERRFSIFARSADQSMQGMNKAVSRVLSQGERSL